MNELLAIILIVFFLALFESLYRRFFETPKQKMEIFIMSLPAKARIIIEKHPEEKRELLKLFEVGLNKGQVLKKRIKEIKVKVNQKIIN